MLHIHNGESSATTLKNAGLGGEHLAWREAYVAGPTPQGLEFDDWIRVRACFLSSANSVDEERCRRELLEQQRALETFKDHDEVVLWFEHDIHCQTILIYLLDWFSKQVFAETKISLICIDEFPGIAGFRGLGQLTAEQMATLFPNRQTVSDDQLILGPQAWNAYCSPDPTAIEILVDRDTSALPFLHDSLIAHLSRFPSVSNGLGSVQQKALDLVRRGANSFGELFKWFSDEDPVLAGMGDSNVWLELKSMADVKEPLVLIKNADPNIGEGRNGYITATFQLTDRGNETLRSQADFIAINGIDRWLGGVHLHGNTAAWRWDPARENLISFRPPTNEARP
jgi:uncharacterized protein DUF1835